ncbi:MAG TPA: EamA family transporter [Caulobacteraceae bacterium]|nr:EamA family transporter [Caulobacteraceae bacterium]
MARASSSPAPSGVVLPLAATVGAMVAFQVGAAFAKGLFPAVGPQGAATLRLLLGAVMLAGVTRPWRGWPRGRSLWPLLGLGVATAGAVQFFYLALEHLPQGVAIALQFLGPLAIAVFGSHRPRDLVWAALAAAGVWAMVGAGPGGAGGAAGHIDALGVVFALGAAASWAAYILFGRAASAAFGNATGAVAIAIAGAILAPFGLARAGAALVSPGLIPLALAVALMSTAVPFSLEFYAMPRLPARTFATFASLEPAFGVLSGFMLLHERLGAVQIAGVAAVIAAAAGAAWSSAAAPAAEAGIADGPPT